MRRLLLVLSLLALVVAVRPAGAQTAEDPAAGPPLETDVTTLDAAVDCPAFTRPDRDPVLLVHGTATTSEASWPWSLGAVLPAEGYDVCTVDLPERALVDQQVSAEYVVHAVRVMAARLEVAGSDRRVDVIGHSQGTLEPRWALRWWPDVRAAVDELVQLAPPNQGAASAQGLCTLGSCPPAAWQMMPGSAYLTALNTDDPVPAEVDITAVVSTTDDLVQPAPAASALPGATVIVIQDLCPGRYVGHVQLLADAVAVAVVLDALGSDGRADAARIDSATCLQTTAPGTDPVEVAASSTALYTDAAVALADGPMTDAEPALRPYAQTEPQGPAEEERPSGEPAAPSPAPAPTSTLPATGGSGVPAVAFGLAAAAVLLLAALRR